MRRLVILLALLTVTTTGCAAMAARANDPNANGPYPDNYQQLVGVWFLTNLKDPYSAQVAWIKEPVRQWCGAWAAPGWVVNVGINAKNSFGGYTGASAYDFCIRDGAVQYVSDLTPR